MKKLVHTPEGVRDIYNGDCLKKLTIENRIHGVLRSYGYSDIQTPTFEFFDIFNKERGSVASKEMYKFFDREGNTLVLRPDMTPSIARASAKYFSDTDAPIKLCYKGNTFINNSSYQGRLKETTQIGAEFIGDNSVIADAEVIAIVIESLLSSGLTDFQVEIGQVMFFKGLVEEAGLDSEVEEELRMLIQEKNYFGVEELVNSRNISKNLCDTFLKLPQLFGSVDILAEAKKLTTNENAIAAIDRLLEMYDILKIYGYEKYVTFDLGMLSNLLYYTGIIFQGLTYGTGEAVVKGGRYDSLLKQFGTDKPSVGFSFTIDQLMVALDRQKIKIIPDEKNTCNIIYTKKQLKRAIELAMEYRKKRFNVNMVLNEQGYDKEYYIENAVTNKASHIIYLSEEEDIDECMD